MAKNNFFAQVFPFLQKKNPNGMSVQAGVVNPNTKAPSFPIAPVQFDRYTADIQVWREAIAEAENAWYPQRVRMQRVYQDTILNSHVHACISKRINLTLQRKFKLCDDNGKEDQAATKLFKASWFRVFQKLTLDALFNGYNLISLGDVVDNEFPNISFVRRQNVAPDRYNVAVFVYSLSGADLTSEPYKDWYIYVTTPSETGVTPCGYGLLYRVALLEIFIRNNMGHNADYNEIFGQPMRIGKTTKQDQERTNFEQGLQQMGASAYAVIDEGDEITLVEAKNSGTTYNTFSDFEKRCEQKISKLILGHTDALESVPGKIGGTQGGQESPVEKALDGIQSEDGAFIEPIINKELIPRMQKFGFPIPLGLHFEYLNDEEDAQIRTRTDNSNLLTAQIVQALAAGKIQVNPQWLKNWTGIDVSAMPQPTPAPVKPPEPDDEDETTKKVKNILRELNIPITLNGNGKH